MTERWLLKKGSIQLGGVATAGGARRQAQWLANQERAPITVEHASRGYVAATVHPEPYCERCDLYSPRTLARCIGCGGEVR